ncbi:lamin tail domain-containing protein [Methanocrinis sp.]|uniref:lamin tail domain-containing protein n=1 Tax=Methanocrinis sp. TaxID=3101522 RepID=UPI003D0A420F
MRIEQSFLVLLALVAASASAVFVEVSGAGGGELDPVDGWPASVVINEVESNPPDGDEDNEWLELYNEGDGDADVGDWWLTTVGGYVVPIESGTIIPAGGFLVVEYEGYWLRNSDEMVILRDEEGDEVDRTPVLSDDDDDDRSWSRHPDGGCEWVLIQSSPGLPVPPMELAAGTLSDLAEDDKMWLRWTGDYRASGLWDVSDFLGS